MKNKIKNIILIILIIAAVALIAFLIINSVRSVSYNKEAKNPVATFTIENYGDIKIELYPDYAPNTVSTFIKLIQNGYYNGKVFYGTDGTAVNAGMSYENKETTEENTDNSASTENTEATENTGNTTGESTDENKPTEEAIKVSDIDTSVSSEDNDSENTENTTEASDSDDENYEISINGEFVANDYDKNTLRFERGTIGLYRSEYDGYGTDLSSYSYNSGKALFFILTKEDSTLNGMYAAFGKVTEGMDIIDKINSLPTKADDETESESSTNEEEKMKIKYFDGNYPVITSATVETYGVDYGMPKYDKAFDYNSWLSNLLSQYYSSNSSSSN